MRQRKSTYEPKQAWSVSKLNTCVLSQNENELRLYLTVDMAEKVDVRDDCHMPVLNQICHHSVCKNEKKNLPSSALSREHT